MASASPQAEAAPADISVISTATSAIEANAELRGEAAENALIGTFTRMVLNQAIAIGDRQGISGVAGLRTKEFKAFTLKKVAPMVERAAKVSNKKKRLEAWHKLLRQASAESAAQQVLANWLDFSAPDAYLDKVKPGPAPSILTQVRTTSNSADVNILEKEIAMGAELGGAGAGNGLIDAGEWVNIDLAIENLNTRFALFSASAWVESGHPCAWVPPGTELEMSELPAKPPAPEEGEEAAEEDPPTHGLGTWVYLSNTCADGAIVPLRVNIYDTQRAPRTPMKLAVELTVRNRTDGRVSGFLLDTDIPGSSDGESAPAIYAGRKFELSHGFTINPAELLRARAGWAMRSDQQPLVAEQIEAPEPLVPAGTGIFVAGEDYDIRLHDQEKYDRMLQRIADEQKWDELSDARAWFATDTEVLYDTPDPATDPEAESAVPDEVCDNHIDDDNDGQIDCADSDCSFENECNLPGPVDFSSVLNIFAKSMSLEAKPASPTLNNAVKAVEPGYELVLDGDVADQYQCLVQAIPVQDCEACALYEVPLTTCSECLRREIPIKECGRCDQYGLTLEECSACIEAGTDLAKCEPEEEDSASEEEEEERTIAYTYRNYFTFPLEWHPNESTDFGNCDDGHDNDLDGRTDAADPDCDVVIPAEAVCDDGIDNDGDGFADCDDSDCPTAKKEEDAQCADGYDNDCDGLVDGDDPDCMPSSHRIDVGLALTTATFSNLPADGLEWTADKGALAAAAIRYVYAPKASGILRLMLSFDSTPGYALVNGGEDSYSSRSLGGGAGLHFGVGEGLAVEPHLLVKNTTMNIAPGAASGIFSEKASGIGLDVGVELHKALTDSLGLYVGANFLTTPDITTAGVAVVDNGMLGGGVGLTYTLPSK
jgi:hypothetical protein